ncbi:MAG: hypothetical protein ACI9W1_002243, partial [Candidatus Azotimanducaceae bacterium]
SAQVRNLQKGHNLFAVSVRRSDQNRAAQPIRKSPRRHLRYDDLCSSGKTVLPESLD